MACAAGVATLQVIEEENLLQRSAETGAYFKKGIEAIAKEFPQVIKEVRGRGMMIGMDLTKEGAGGMLMALMIDQHIIVAYTLNNPKVIRDPHRTAADHAEIRSGPCAGSIAQLH